MDSDQPHLRDDDQDAIESGNESECNGVDSSIYSKLDEEVHDGIEALLVEQNTTVQDLLADLQMQVMAMLSKRKSAIVLLETELRDARVENRDLREYCHSAGMSLVEMDTRQCETGGTGEASSSAAPACTSSVALPPAQPKKKHRPGPKGSSAVASIRETVPAPSGFTPVPPAGMPLDLQPYTIEKSNTRPTTNQKGQLKQLGKFESTPNDDDKIGEHRDVNGAPHDAKKDNEEVHSRHTASNSGQQLTPPCKIQQSVVSPSSQPVDRYAYNDGSHSISVVPEPEVRNRKKPISANGPEDTEFTGLTNIDSWRTSSAKLTCPNLSNPGKPRFSSKWSSSRSPSQTMSGRDLAYTDIANRTDGGKMAQAVFADSAAMKDKVRRAVTRAPYNVHDYYHEDGIWQFIARHAYFENITLCVIASNALWIAVDTDLNKANTLAEADFFFQFVENSFCVYFSAEWLIRFMAFRKKTKAFTDGWFCFDSALVLMMVAETWLMYLFVLSLGGSASGALGNASVLRLFRLLRLSRMARMARLLRAMPELLILIKGIKVATRSVFFTLCLLMLIIYVFAVGFTQALQDTEAGDDYFHTVIEAVNSLLLKGVLPDQSEMVEAVGQEHLMYRLAMLFYILLASLTVMNMLVGVLCEVVSVVSSVEKETLLVNFVKQQLQPMLITETGNTDYKTKITKSDFTRLLEQQNAARALQDVGVDVVSLVDFTDFIFQNGRELTFSDCMDVVLQLRGTNASTVKDIVDLRKQVLAELAAIKEESGQRHEHVMRLLFSQRGTKSSPSLDMKFLQVTKTTSQRSGRDGDSKDADDSANCSLFSPSADVPGAITEHH